MISMKIILIFFATGVVTSPNYPGNYPNNIRKTETLQVEDGLVLSLQFTAFHIESDTFQCGVSCACDHLTITDGDGTTLMEKSCGSILPANITSTSNIINLLFSSTSVKLYLSDRRNDVMTGWSLNWRAVEPGECQPFL